MKLEEIFARAPAFLDQAQREHYYEQGWTDGLPIVPPTEDLVDAMLRYTDRDRNEVVADIVPRGGQATIEKSRSTQ